MDEMLSLLADHGFCFLAEQLFLEQLPEDICLQLSNDDFTNPRALAIKADVLWIANSKQLQQSTKSITTKHRSPLHMLHVKTGVSIINVLVMMQRTVNNMFIYILIGAHVVPLNRA